MSTFAKYMERYKSREEKKREDPPSKREDPPPSRPRHLSTDRNAYISYLEENIDRVTQQYSDLQHYLQETRAQNAQQTQKLQNVLKVVRLLQSSESGHDESILKLKARISHLENSRVGVGHSPSPASFERVQHDLQQEQRLAYLEDRMNQLGGGGGGKSEETDQWENSVRSFQRQMEEILRREREQHLQEIQRLELEIHNVGARSAKGIDTELLSQKLSKIERSMNSYFAELEEQMKNLQKNLDSKVNRRELDHLKRIVKENKKNGAQSARSTTRSLQDQSFRDELKQMRTLVNRNVQDGVDRMGNIVKQYLSSLKHLETKVNGLERNKPTHHLPPPSENKVKFLKPPSAAKRQGSSSLRQSADLRDVVLKKSNRSHTAGCSPNASRDLVGKLSPITQKNQNSILSSEYEENIMPHIPQRIAREPIRRIYRTNEYERNLSKGARQLRDSLEEMTRSQSLRKSRDRAVSGSHSFERGRPINRDLGKKRLTIVDTFEEGRRPYQRRLGGMVSRSPRNSVEVRKRVGAAHSFHDITLHRSPIRSASANFRQNRSFSRDRLSNRASFSFSPYSTKRSRLFELQARLRREKDLKQRIISQLVQNERKSERVGRLGSQSQGNLERYKKVNVRKMR